MKEIFKKLLTFIFSRLTYLYLTKNKIEIVAITGSAGKTTAKMTIAKLLPSHDTYTPKEAYNTEIGIPLAVFKLTVPEKTLSILAWLKILANMLVKEFQKPDFKRIILEMGADKPGDIKYLTSYIKPDIAVITSVFGVHLENFKNIEAVAAEKNELVRRLKPTDTAVLNYDDEIVRKMSETTPARIFWVGRNESCDLRWQELKFSKEGLSLNLYYEGKKYPVKLKIIAPQLVVSLLSAFAVGIILGQKIPELIEKISEFETENGRMKLLSGLKNSIIIDDSYNANPESVTAALDVLDKIPGRKIAVLGGMNELGGSEGTSHALIATKSAAIADEIVFIGQKAEKLYLSKIKEAGYRNFHWFGDPYQAGEYLAQTVKEGDVILVKGSQNGIFAEETVKIILAEPEKAEEVLVRQSDFWQNKKQTAFNLKGEK